MSNKTGPRARKPVAKTPARAPQPKQASPEAAAQPLPWWRQVLHEPLAVCLVPAVMFRPWLDGITYPTDNFYFVWFLALLFSIWAVRLLLTGYAIRFGRPILLLAAFFIVAVLTGLGTVQVNATYRMILVWAGYFFLFVLVTNGLRTRVGVGIVLGAFAVVYFAECVWSLLHFHYVLPFVRQMIRDDPRLLVQFFGSPDLTAELAHRLNTNRAFGSMLFPNALGAFLIMGIPFAFAGTVHGWHAFVVAWRGRREAQKGSESIQSRRLLWSVVIGVAAFVVMAGAGFFLFTFAKSMSDPGYRWNQDIGLLFVLVVFVPLVLAAIPLLTTRFHGPLLCGLLVRAVGFPVVLLLGLVNLWLTYSRGAMIGLTLAAVLTAALFLLGQGKARRAARIAAAVLIAAVSVGVAAGTATWAQEDQVPLPDMPKPATAIPLERDAKAVPVVPGDPRIDVKGRALGVSDLTNLGSLRNRLSYWQTGLVMAKANWWKGVGLGNFRTAYPRYQPLDAADVKMAHNDYLQTLCETGVFGLLAFAAFWGYFAVWGAVRIVKEGQGLERLILAGLYAGVLALLAHSVVDFNFYNPSLAFYLFLLTGVFYVMAAPQDAAPKRKAIHQVIAVPFLVAAALTAGMTLRVYLTDFVLGGSQVFNVGNNKVLMAKQRVGEFFLREVRPDRPKGSPAAESVMTLAQLMPLRSHLESFGQIWVPPATPGGRNRRLGPNESVPPNAFLVVTNPVLARQMAIATIENWLQVIITADGIFPYDPEVAAHLVTWYDLLLECVDDAHKRQGYTLEFLKWAKESVERSPLQSWHHEWYARALWLRAHLETGAAKEPYLRKAIEEFRVATELYPSSSIGMRQYAEALTNFGEYLKRTGKAAEGNKAIAEARNAIERSEHIVSIRGTRLH